jgi:hypothetical protein
VEHSETSAPGKTASIDPAYLNLFQKTAAHVTAFLPPRYSENDKVAQVRYMMGLNDTERSQHLHTLHKHAGTANAEDVAQAYHLYARKVAEEEAAKKKDPAAPAAPPKPPWHERAVDSVSDTAGEVKDWATASAQDVKAWVQNKLKKDEPAPQPAAPAAK